MVETKGFSTQDKLATDDDEFLGQLKNWHEYAKKNRQVFDWKWYLFASYRKGDHYVQYNKLTNQLVTPTRSKSQVRLVVNRIYSITRAILNFATSYRPKWFVVANSTTEEVVNNGQKSAEVLDYYFDHLNMPRQVRGVGRYAVDYGIGFWQYAWDEESLTEDGQLGDCVVWTRDPFDVYLDPAGMETGNIQNCRFIDIAVSTPIQNIVDNPTYNPVNEDEVSPDTKRAASDFKNILITSQYGGDLSPEKELGTVILHETLYKKRVEIKDEAGKGTGQYESQVWVASWIDGHLLRNEQTEFKKYNLIPVPSDDNPNEIYGEGYIKNLIPLNKVLNRLESQVVEYNNIVNRGRIIADKNSGVTRITNETGEIIEKNAGASVEPWNPGGLAPDMSNQIGRLNGYMDEVSGVTQAFQGNTPEGVTAGVALESLRAQSANNLQDFKDSIEGAFAELGEGILELVANKVVTTRTVKRTGKNGKLETFKFKGQVGVDPDEELDKDTYIIGAANKVKVVVGSDLAYTREGRIARLKELLEIGVIDPQTFLENLDFGNVDEISKRAQQHKFDQSMMKGIESGRIDPQTGKPVAPPAPMGGGAMPPVDGQPPAQAAGQPADPMLQLADQENEKMLNGENVPPTQGATKEHTAIHIAWSQSDEVAQNDEVAQVLFAHIQGEEQEQGLVTPPAS